MKILDKLFGSKNVEEQSIETENSIIYAPVSGHVVSLKEVNDGVFSEGVLGDGCAVQPTENILYAPFGGKVQMVADTKHAIGLQSQDGMELLLHVGIDTVMMNGKGFHPVVSAGDCVKCGQILMEFNQKEIKEAGYPDTVVILVTNSGEYQNIICNAGEKITKLEKLMTVK